MDSSAEKEQESPPAWNHKRHTACSISSPGGGGGAVPWSQQGEVPQGCARFAEILTFFSGAPTNLSSTRQELHDFTMKSPSEMNEHLLWKNWRCAHGNKISAKRAHPCPCSGVLPPTHVDCGTTEEFYGHRRPEQGTYRVGVSKTHRQWGSVEKFG